MASANLHFLRDFSRQPYARSEVCEWNNLSCKDSQRRYSTFGGILPVRFWMTDQGTLRWPTIGRNLFVRFWPVPLQSDAGGRTRRSGPADGRSTAERKADLVWYTVTEHYTIRDSHFGKPAEATVQAAYQQGQGATYNVLSRSGPSLLRNIVLDRLLREASEMSHGEMQEQSIIT